MIIMESEQLKVVIIGDATVGKSCILHRYVSNTFQEHSTPTLGAAYHTRVLEVDNKSVKLNIWDTAGQERYHSLAKLYSRDAKLIVLVYDITNRSTFEGMKRWHESIIKEGIDKKAAIGIFGNKEDLLEQEEVTLEEAKKYSHSIDAVFKRTSAKLNVGIEEGFYELSKKYLKVDEVKIEKASFTLSDKQIAEKKAKKSSCC